MPDEVHLPLGGRVVGVGADEDDVVGVVDALKGVFQHAPDNGGFIPAGNHHGDALLRLGEELLFRQGRILGKNEEPAVCRSAEVA